jgi:hypothetical protein
MNTSKGDSFCKEPTDESSGMAVSDVSNLGLFFELQLKKECPLSFFTFLNPLSLEEV